MKQIKTPKKPSKKLQEALRKNLSRRKQTDDKKSDVASK